MRTAISNAPMIPALLPGWSILSLIRRMDEMQRKLQLEAFVVWPIMCGFWFSVWCWGACATDEHRIQELRARKNWSQMELAARLDVSRQTINALERGRYDPSLPLAFKIARVFDLTIEEIFIVDALS